MKIEDEIKIDFLLDFLVKNNFLIKISKSNQIGQIRYFLRIYVIKARRSFNSNSKFLI